MVASQSRRHSRSVEPIGASNRNSHPFQGKNRRIRILVVHETHLIGGLLATVLEHEPDIEVLGCVSTLFQALQYLKWRGCDLALVSYSLLKMDGFQLAQALAQFPCNLLVMGAPESEALILGSVEARVAGYIHNEEGLADFVQEIRALEQSQV